MIGCFDNNRELRGYGIWFTGFFTDEKLFLQNDRSEGTANDRLGWRDESPYFANFLKADSINQVWKVTSSRFEVIQNDNCIVYRNFKKIMKLQRIRSIYND